MTPAPGGALALALAAAHSERVYTGRMPSMPLPESSPFLTDGGLETALTYLHGVDLSEFAAFPLLDSAEGRVHLEDYFVQFLRLASATRLPFLLDTPTWRANADWGDKLGYDARDLDRVNRDAVAFAQELRERHAREHPAVLIEGVIGPRADGYVVGKKMTTAEAGEYHSSQVRALAEGGADLLAAVTMTYVDEGGGVALAARAADIPVVISFTVETDGRLPSGETLAEAITMADEQTDAYPLYYMVNCAHPDHFAPALNGDWVARVGGIRANASRLSHVELDEATELDAGDPIELAAEYRELRRRLPSLRVFGGCCGTDIRHLREIAAVL
jgi:homocysteine S-methyltransferase